MGLGGDLGLLAGVWTSRLEFGPPGWDFGLQARIWALRPGLGPQGWNLGLETGILALRLEFRPRDWDLRGGTEKKMEEEKIPHMCESIGHQPLWGRCPAPPFNFKPKLLRQGTVTADHLTLLRLF